MNRKEEKNVTSQVDNLPLEKLRGSTKKNWIQVWKGNRILEVELLQNVFKIKSLPFLHVFKNSLENILSVEKPHSQYQQQKYEQ